MFRVRTKSSPVAAPADAEHPATRHELPEPIARRKLRRLVEGKGIHTPAFRFCRLIIIGSTPVLGALIGNWQLGTSG
ncbi:MAG: hypothetical protein J07HQW1_02188 [Haloquadratum walsbyi J07HQW1]|uniref:Uncharacterized protein n=1 Tax=Haloquadratum walsbyi J07HQW1 TaxID=1238424 RepID=U1N6R9_9EURY|nr:MAG: hypothetical protein J07HQW1_02188 [Haloquadratum walsbyi J07HQW1]